jgi:hypothetical protein
LPSPGHAVGLARHIDELGSIHVSRFFVIVTLKGAKVLYFLSPVCGTDAGEAPGATDFDHLPKGIIGNKMAIHVFSYLVVIQTTS